MRRSHVDVHGGPRSGLGSGSSLGSGSGSGSGAVRRTTSRSSAVAIAAVVVLALATSLGVSGTRAASVRTWVARVGTAGANGAVVLALTSATAGSASVALKGLPAGSVVTGAVRRGSCARRGAVVAPLASGPSSAGGRFSKRRTLTAVEATAASRASSLIVTIRAGSVSRCAPLVERVAPMPTPSPTPTPVPTSTAAPTASPSPSASPGASALPGIGKNVMVGGVTYLSVRRVDPFTDAAGGTGVLVQVRFEAFSAGLQASSADFTLRLADGTIRRPTYVSGSDELPDSWRVTLPTGGPYQAWLLFAAPVLGRLDLLFDGSFGSAGFHVRD